MSALLAFDGLSKDWFGVAAVSGITLEVEEGTTLGLIGENGAGKSTLMNMVGGVVAPSAGRMTWRGEPYAPATPADATLRGVAFIHQELNLFTNLSIAENVFIDGFPAASASSTAAASPRRPALSSSGSISTMRPIPSSASSPPASASSSRSPRRCTAMPT